MNSSSAIAAIAAFHSNQGYILWATPRCGGTLLCRLLAATNVAGRPEEYFFRPLEAYYFNQWKCGSYSEYLYEVVKYATTPNGVLGLKLDAGDYLSHFESQLRTVPEFRYSNESFLSLLKILFGEMKFVWLTRRNKARQCVSWLRAAQTREWIRGIVEDDTRSEEEQYDFEALDRLMSECVMREAAQQEIFAELGILPLTVVYEDMVNDTTNSILRILDHLEVWPSGAIYKAEDVGMQKQADSTSEEWVQRYRAEKQERWAHIAW